MSKNTVRVLVCLAIASILAIAVTIIISSTAGAIGKERPKCPKKCQGENDLFFAPKDYTDLFVNDSDGHKDSVFTIYHNVPFPTAGEGVKCDVLKSFDNEGVGIAVVCPNGARVAVSTGSQSNVDDANK